MLKPKVGDLVRLKPLLVEWVGEEDLSDMLVASGKTLNISYVEEILPRPLAVGDRVIRIDKRHDIDKSYDNRATVLGVYKDWVWIVRDLNEALATFRMDELKRIDKP